MKLPGPDHPITIAKNPKQVTVEVGGKVIALSTHALSLREAAYPAVQYVPVADVDQSLLSKTSHSTHCPYKGDASYWTIEAGGQRLENAVWGYEQPYPAVEQIRGHVAFYPNKVTITEA